MPELRSQFLFTIKIGVSQLHDLGETPFGVRHIDMLGPGSFEGPRLRGEVLAGGMDQKLHRADGAMIPNVRLVLQCHDGALIYMTYSGIRHGSPEVMARIARGEAVAPSDYYLRNTPTFETAAASYAWLNRILAVGVGRRLADHAAYEIFEIL
jgi:hypothetical protein